MVRKRLVAKGRDSNGRPRQTFADEVQAMDDAAFDAAMRRATWLASFARTQPTSDFHWQLDVCSREAAGRGRPSPVRSAAACAGPSDQDLRGAAPA